MSIRKLAMAAALAGGLCGGVHASTVIAQWTFDTAWAPGAFDSSGYGGGWTSRAGQFNSVSMDYADAAAYGRTGGVAVITNSGNALSNGQAANLFAGVRLLLVDGPGNPNADGYAFREAFEASLHKSFRPFVEVDFWDSRANASAGLFALSIKPTDNPFNAGSFNRVATSTATPDLLIAREDVVNGGVLGSTARLQDAAWRTLRMVLEADGDVEYFVDGALIGTSTQKYNTLASAYDTAFSLLVGPVGSIAGAQGVAVFDNFRFGQLGTVPTPGTLALVGLALGGLGLASRQRRRTV